VAGNNKKALIAALLIAPAFAYALISLFTLGLETGDVYPQYSSYRADPLGASAFFDALASMPGVTAVRNTGEFSELPPGRGRTLIFMGADTGDDPEDVLKSLEAFAASGGRLVILFYPLSAEPYHWFDHDTTCEDSDTVGEQENKKCGDEKKEGGKVDAGEKVKDGSTAEDGTEPEQEPGAEKSERKKKFYGKPGPWETKMVSIADRWGFAFAYSDPIPDADNAPAASRAEKQSGPELLPPAVSWHSVLYFDKLKDNWRILYGRLGLPVVVERPYGKGSIVLMGDSYLASNEAMRNERLPGLLAWLVGPSSTVIFDEAHLGMEQAKGVMILMRRFRLDALLLALGFIALLFVWQNASSLVPKRGGLAPAPAQGRDSAAGLVNLLRRAIPRRDVLSVCENEWRRSLGPGSEAMKRKAARVHEIVRAERALPPGRHDPAGAYKRISKILAKRSGRP